jgi:hypothetical protein
VFKEDLREGKDIKGIEANFNEKAERKAADKLLRKQKKKLQRKR